MKARLLTRRTLIIALSVIVGIATFMVVRGARRPATPPLTMEAVERRDIALTIEATGTVEPIDLVEVKSKASGQIIRMPVQVGSTVRAGDLLAQIDARDVKNQYDQTLAALRAAQAKVDISRAQKKRSDELFGQAVITADEHESAVLDFANSQAQLVKARTDLDLAKQRLEDATVRAPVAGTVLEQTVADGQVISSATSSASGGTTLLKMADLSRIRLRALVSETDIGSVHPGQTATVSVEAFPQRPFTGQVEKIEPQAVVQQSVTMFPVLISISNEQGLLLPGMNGEVAMLVDRRDNVPAVPMDALRSVREVAVAAQALGLNPGAVRAQVDRQMQERVAARAAADSNGGTRTLSASNEPRSDSERGRWSGRGRSGADSARAGGRGAGRRGRGAWAGGGRGGSSAGAGSESFAGGGAASGGAGVGQGRGGRASRSQVVFVKTAREVEPRVVRIGLSDFDYAEVLDGVKEGEQVVMLGVVEAQAQRTQQQDRIRQRMGSGVPGVPGGGGGGGGRGGAGGGGGGPGGGGSGGGRGGS